MTPFLIALFAVIAAIFVFVNNSPKYVGWNAEGFEGFLAYYDFPLKVLAASVITLTLSLSIKRLFKTEKQIQLSEAGSLRSNYLELASSYQDHIKVLGLDLKRNMNHFFPMMTQGNPELEPSIKTALRSIIRTIQEVKPRTLK